ncbi:cobalamin biosynthesis protein CbiD [Desulfuribacillus stibiiarsenatis]|uniref:Cobalt-precorrin-5B C(1)-methyltransferase n=2 Tax=Desulfuribacillus stibiiarsenatis TaxID=1390249 RepID=A0A1E5L410_9FIRM|nr:cobalamin biosynthesis protein CbiD [Desulfuribacillus stibiiarsenatis]
MEWQPYRLVEGRKLRRGFTTGAAATAATKAALELLSRQFVSSKVDISLPTQQEYTVSIPIDSCFYNKDGSVTAFVIKDGGDDPDVTNGIKIGATVKYVSFLNHTDTTLDESNQAIHINGGTGIGIVTKQGLKVRVGEHAINPVPRQMIKNVAKTYAQRGKTINITIFVPEGEKIAHKTLNPALGIIGGISILGTTGIVEPMSEEAYKESLVPQLDMVQALGYDTVFLTPGRRGQLTLNSFGIPLEQTVQMSNFVGYMLKECQIRKFKKVILFGTQGKLIKLAGGIFHTHHRVADARIEILISEAALNEVPIDLLFQLRNEVTIEASVKLLQEHGYHVVLQKLCEKAAMKAADYIQNEIEIGVVFLDIDGKIVAKSNSVDQWW